jgi:hypothetical protein
MTPDFAPRAPGWNRGRGISGFTQLPCLVQYSETGGFVFTLMPGENHAFPIYLVR